jgi:hypothetical protein
MQAGRVARALVKQVLHGAAHLDGKQIDIRVGGGTAKPQPESVWKGAHAGGARDFQGRLILIMRGTWPRLQPDSLLPYIGHFKARRRLRPGAHFFADKRIQ